MKLNGNSYLQWNKFIKINSNFHGQKSHLCTDPPSIKKDEWEQDDVTLFGQLLNVMEPKI